jgi:hypothetical protein
MNLVGTISSASPWKAHTGTRASAHPATGKASKAWPDEHGTGDDIVSVSGEVIPGPDGTATDAREIHPAFVDVVVIEREVEERVDLVGMATLLRLIGSVLRHQHDERAVLGPLVVLDEHRDPEFEDEVERGLAAVAVSPAP